MSEGREIKMLVLDIRQKVLKGNDQEGEFREDKEEAIP